MSALGWKQPASCPLNVKTARLWRGIVPFTHLAREGRMRVTIGRRELLVALGAASVAWPLAARAQHRLPTIGVLGVATFSAWQSNIAVFTQRLNELGWSDARTLAFEYRWAEGNSGRFPDLAAELVRLKVDVILTAGGAVPAAKQATTTIPIVFAVAF